VFAVILAGGSGTRLWPMARVARPKQFVPLFDGRSLFQMTWDRVRPVVDESKILVVCGTAHLPQVRRQAPAIPARQIIMEGAGRNTAASIALAALWIRRRVHDAVMLVLPSDHWIARPNVLRAALRRGVEIVRRRGGLLTLGVKPRSADTGYGYIGPWGREVAPGVRVAHGFVEKPAAVAARRLMKKGRVYWNSGMFIWKATAVLEALRHQRPSILGPLANWVLKGPGEPWRVPASVLRRVEALPIDRAVLERSRDLLVMRADFGWSDLGNWDALGAILDKNGEGNASMGELLTLDARRCLAVNEAGLTVFVGIHDVFAVRSGNVLLVSGRSSAQRVREVVARLGGRWPRLL